MLLSSSSNTMPRVAILPSSTDSVFPSCDEGNAISHGRDVTVFSIPSNISSNSSEASTSSPLLSSIFVWNRRRQCMEEEMGEVVQLNLDRVRDHNRAMVERDRSNECDREVGWEGMKQEK